VHTRVENLSETDQAMSASDIARQRCVGNHAAMQSYDKNQRQIALHRAPTSMPTVPICASRVGTVLVDDESVPWVPLAPLSDKAQIKYLRLDPVRGEIIALVRLAAGARLPRHHHSGSVIVYTLEGRWKYLESDWIAGPGSMVFDSAASAHTPQVVGNGAPATTLNIIMGDVTFYSGDNEVLAIENWKSSLQRYLDYCACAGIAPRDLTALAAT